MANYNTIEAEIDSNIVPHNNAQLITGAKLNTVLKNIVGTLGDGYRYKGIVTPSSAAITTDNNIFVIASTQGTYTNFGGLTVASGEVAALYYDSSWHKATIDLSKLTVGDLFADSATIDGDVNVNGNVNVDNGYVNAENINASNNLDVSNKATISQLDVSGDSRMSGDVHFERDVFIDDLDVRNEFSSLENNKANIDGYYSQMGVGVADNLAGRGTAVGAEFTRRTTGGSQSVGDGSARFKSVKGKTVVWNQLVKNGNFDGTTNWAKRQSGATISASDNVLHYSAGTYTGEYNVVYQAFDFVAGHQYVIRASYKSATDTTRGAINLINTGYTPLKRISYIYPTAAWKTIEVLFEGVDAPRLSFSCGTDFDLANVNVFDLTLMGIADAVSTVADFKALFPLPIYTYNAGQLLSLNASGIVTDGFNQFNGTYARVFGGKEYYINGAYTAVKFATTVDGTQTDVTVADRLFTPSEDGYVFVTGADGTTCINLSWSGRRNGEYEDYWQSTRDLNLTTLTGKVGGTGASSVIFADGMRGEGSVHDELIAEGGLIVKAVKRFGIVDLGTLDWRARGSGIFDLLTSSQRVFTSNNIICAKYPTNKVMQNPTSSSVPDKIIYAYSYYQLRDIIVKDSAYVDATAAEFKAAMSGVMLIYELATPVEYVLDSPINANYLISDFGTETIVPEGVDAQGVPMTAPMVADIIYGVNAPDILANLPKDYISKASFDDFCAKLSTALGLTITSVWDASSNKYVFTIVNNE